VTLFAFASCHDSPGTTTTVLGLAATWTGATRREVLVVEADPDGGVLASRFDGLRADRTLADVVVDVRRTFDRDAVLASTRPLWDTVPVVVAPPSAEQTHAALSAGGDRFAAGLAAANVDVLVDVGRLTARSPALHLARRAVATILVTRPTLEAAALMAARVPELLPHGCEPHLLLIGDRPYAPEDFERAVGAPVTAVLPVDGRAASLLSGGVGTERMLRRSLLWRAMADVASRLATLVPRPIEAPAPDPRPPLEATQPAGADA
jgi:hypothetical protein